MGAGRVSRAFVPDTVSERLVLGVQPVREALRVHGQRASRLLLQRGAEARLAPLVHLAERQAVAVRWVARQQLDQLSQGTLHQGAAVMAPALRVMEFQELAPKQDLLLCLDGIVDPQNFGAVVRSAVALCDATIVWGENSAAPLSPTTFRASAGAIEHASLCRVPSLKGAVTEGKARGFSALCLDAHGEQLLSQQDLTLPTMIILGSEGAGVSRGVRRAADSRVRLVDMHAIDSLNASVAAALALYQVHCQRHPN
jgi:23S rRNA (guanosine2251-2'-O)-methyltransferase